jgi:hypothetical protein
VAHTRSHAKSLGPSRQNVKVEQLRGRWWIPGDRKRYRTGVLEIDESSNLILSLDRAFPSDGHLIVEYPVIHGVTSSGEEVTLADSFQIRGPASWMGPKSEQRIAVNVALRGALIDNPESPIWTRIRWQYEGFQTAGVGQFNVSADETDSHGRQVRTATATRPGNLSVRLNSGNLTIGHDVASHTSLTRVELSQQTSFHFDSTTPLSHGNLVAEVVNPVTYYLSLATAGQLGTPSMQLAGPTFDRVGGRRVLRFVDVVRPPGATASELPQHWNMPLPLRDEDLDHEALIQRWFQLYADSREALDLHFTLSIRSDLPIQARLLLSAQALEVYHRKMRTMDAAKEAERKERVAEVVATSPPAHLKWLEAKLAFAHEPSLSERLSELLKPTRPYSKGLIRADFSGQMTATRNYLTHYEGAERKSVIKEPRKLLYLIEEAVLLTTATLLTDLGLSPKDAWDRLGRTRRVRLLIQHAGRK